MIDLSTLRKGDIIHFKAPNPVVFSRFTNGFDDLLNHPDTLDVFYSHDGRAYSASDIDRVEPVVTVGDTVSIPGTSVRGRVLAVAKDALGNDRAWVQTLSYGFCSPKLSECERV